MMTREVLKVFDFRGKARWVVGILLLAGCAQTQPTVVYKGITDPSMLVEQRPLPPSPDAAPLTDAQNETYPLLKGTAAPVDGVLITPEKAARVLKLKVSYDELRSLYVSDRQIFAQNRVIYEERLQQANAEIQRLSPTWWSQHGAEITAVAGFIVGAALTLGIYDLSRAVTK